MNRALADIASRLEDITAILMQRGGGGGDERSSSPIGAVHATVPAGTSLYAQPVSEPSRETPLVTFEEDTIVLLLHPQESVGGESLWMLTKYAAADLSVYVGWLQVKNEDGELIPLANVSIAA